MLYVAVHRGGGPSLLNAWMNKTFMSWIHYINRRTATLKAMHAPASLPYASIPDLREANIQSPTNTMASSWPHDYPSFSRIVTKENT